MSQENVEVFRAAIEAWNAGAADAIFGRRTNQPLRAGRARLALLLFAVSRSEDLQASGGS